VANRALVLDANILIRAVLGRGARQLIQQYAASIDFVAPDTAFIEAEEHIPALCAKLGLDLDAVRAVYTGVSNLVQEDNDFFGAGVSTWTSDRVELYLVEE
jgi:predicted nucleic acid-binding protein